MLAWTMTRIWNTAAQIYIGTEPTHRYQTITETHCRQPRTVRHPIPVPSHLSFIVTRPLVHLILFQLTPTRICLRCTLAVQCDMLTIWMGLGINGAPMTLAWQIRISGLLNLLFCKNHVKDNGSIVIVAPECPCKCTNMVATKAWMYSFKSVIFRLVLNYKHDNEADKVALFVSELQRMLKGNVTNQCLKVWDNLILINDVSKWLRHEILYGLEIYHTQ